MGARRETERALDTCYIRHISYISCTERWNSDRSSPGVVRAEVGLVALRLVARGAARALGLQAAPKKGVVSCLREAPTSVVR
jgi:hypothetical protein